MRSTPPQSRRKSVSSPGARTKAVRPPHGSIRQAGYPDNSDLCETEVVNLQKVARARAALPEPHTLGTLAAQLRALGDPTRLQIVCALGVEGVDELCVCDLATLVRVSQSAVSHSLRTLRQLGLVRYRKVGTIAYYTLNDAPVAQFVRDGMWHIQPARIRSGDTRRQAR